MRATLPSSAPSGSRRTIAAPGAVAEHLFTVLALFIFSRALLHQLAPSTTEDGLGLSGIADNGFQVTRQPLLFWVYVAIYCVSAALLLRCWRTAFSMFLAERYVSLLLVLSAASSIWSTVPLETLSKTTAMIGCSLFACYVTVRYAGRQLLSLLAQAMYLVVIASFVCAVFFPEIGVMKGWHEGLWRGAFVHKNALGTAAALAAMILYLQASSVPPSSRFLWWLGFWPSLMLLVMACSKSALLVTAIIFSLLTALMWQRGEGRLASPIPSARPSIARRSSSWARDAESGNSTCQARDLIDPLRQLCQRFQPSGRRTARCPFRIF